MKTLLSSARPLAFGLILILAANAANAMVTDTEEATSISTSATAALSKLAVAESGLNTSPQTQAQLKSEMTESLTPSGVLGRLKKEPSLLNLKKPFEAQVHKLLRTPQTNDDRQQIDLFLLQKLQAQIIVNIENSGFCLSFDDTNGIRDAVSYQSSFELVELAKNEDLRRAHIRVDILDLLKSESLHDYFLVDWYLRQILADVTELDLSVLLVINPLNELKKSPIKNLLRLPSLNKFTALTGLTLCLPPLPLESELTHEQVSGLHSIVSPLATLENYEALLDLPKLEKLLLTQSRRVVFYGVKESSMTTLSTERDELKQIKDPHNILPNFFQRAVNVLWKVSFIGKGQEE